MKKQILALTLLALAAGAQAQSNDTLAKVKAAGKIVMGVRESSSPLSYTLGDGKYTGYHVELCERVIKALAPTAATSIASIKGALIRRRSRIRAQPTQWHSPPPLLQHSRSGATRHCLRRRPFA